MTEKTGTPAPAAESSAPAVAPPSERREVDLSDLQAELDSEKSKAEEEEIFNDIAGKGKDGDPEDADDEDDADPADEAVDGDDEESDDADAEDKPKKRSRGDRYRDQITRLEHELALLRNLPRGGTTEAQINELVLARIGPEPQEKDFDSFLNYEHHRIAWLTRKETAKDVVLEAMQRAQRERAEDLREKAERHQERAEIFRTRFGEESAKKYDAIMAKAEKLRVSPTVERLILKSPKSEHVQFFLAQSPKRLDQLNRMDGEDAAVEIKLIEQRLTLPQPRTKTAAPPPSRAPKGGAGPTSQEAILNAWGKKKYGSNW